MSNYYHGIRVLEEATPLAVPVTGTAGLQVIFGTAPINLAKSPYKAVNIPFLCNNFAECTETFGYSDDFDKYTLCQSMNINFKVIAVAPIILINVLDPKKHFKKNAPTQITVIAKQAVVGTKGILLDSVVVKDGETELEAEKDYILSFNDDGFVIITFLAGGAGEALSKVTVESNSIDPDAVTKEDLIGGYDITEGKETGIETVRQVYPRFGMTPGLLLAPGWSHYPEVGAVLAAKCERLNGVFRTECLIDLDTEKAKVYTECKSVKEESGFGDAHQAVLWPMLKLGDKIYAYSAVFGALTAYTDASNDDVPNLSPSNRILGVSGAVLKDKTEVVLDQDQANTLNGQGIITSLNDGGWKTWGNNTACYPRIIDPKERWLCCRRFFSWWGNTFIINYKEKVDNPGNKVLIESICDSENVRGNSYVSQGKCAGARMEYLESENTVENILDGKIQFRQYLAPFTPAENIVNTISFDPEMLKAALTGGQ